MAARVIVAPSAADAVAQAHRLVLDALADALEQRGIAHLALCGGSTPRPLYERLEADPGSVDFQRVHLWWSDERAVPPTHDDSNHRLAQDAWLSHVHINVDSIHRLRGDSPDLDSEAARAAGEMVRVMGNPPRLDLALLGMGADGHTASLFPGSPAAAEMHRWVVAVHSGAPRHARLTMTPATLAQARMVLVLTIGPDKAAALARALRDDLAPGRLPVQYPLRLHPAAVVVSDAAAAALLPR